MARLPTPYGEFTAYTYGFKDSSNPDGHLVCVLGEEFLSQAPPLVRIHSECLTGDVLGSFRCDCGQQLHTSLEMMANEGSGILVYLRGQEGRGIGIAHKLRAYELQDEGYDTVDANLMQDLPADARSYAAAAEILKDILKGLPESRDVRPIPKIRLMTNNPAKLKLADMGIEISERIALESSPTAENLDYLKTKRDRLGHLLSGLG